MTGADAVTLVHEHRRAVRAAVKAEDALPPIGSSITEWSKGIKDKWSHVEQIEGLLVVKLTTG